MQMCADIIYRLVQMCKFHDNEDPNNKLLNSTY